MVNNSPYRVTPPPPPSVLGYQLPGRKEPCTPPVCSSSPLRARQVLLSNPADPVRIDCVHRELLEGKKNSMETQILILSLTRKMHPEKERRHRPSFPPPTLGSGALFLLELYKGTVQASKR